MAYVFKKLADSYTSLTMTEKKNLFIGSNYLKPTISELQGLGEFTCLSYSDSNSAKFTITGVPNDQLVVPTSLINISTFEGINSITITNSVSSGGSVNIVVTTDMETYYTYNFTDEKWVAVNLNKTDVKSSGLTLTSIGQITRDIWNELTINTSTIGFAYLLSKNNESDNVDIDKLTLNVDMKGSWNHAIYGTDVTYGYPLNNELKVTLLTDGSYKINYNNLGASA